MKTNSGKALNIFNTFSKPEMQEFKIFLKTNYFNESEVLCELFNEVVKLYPDKLSDGAIEKILGRHYFRKRKYTPARLREYAYRLNKKAQEFLVYGRFRKDNYLKHETLLDELFLRGLGDIFKKRYDDFMEEFDELPKNVIHYHREYILKSKLYNYTEVSTPLLKHHDVKKKITDMGDCAQTLDTYYFIESVSTYVTFVINCGGLGIDTKDSSIPDHELLEKIYGRIKNVHADVTKLYFLLLKTFSDMDETAHYKRYRDHYFAVYSRLHPFLQHYHYHTLIKYLIIKRAHQNNRSETSVELFYLYKECLEKKIYSIENKFIRSTMLINIIKLSAEMKSFDMIKNFVRENPSEIDPADRDTIKFYINAYENFTLGNFETALAEINKIPYKSFSYKYETKMLKIRLLCELGDYDLALTNIKAYRKFLKADKFLNQDLKLITHNFLKYLETLILKSHKTHDLEFNLSKLKEENKICHKQWLIEKYESFLRK